MPVTCIKQFDLLIDCLTAAAATTTTNNNYNDNNIM